MMSLEMSHSKGGAIFKFLKGYNDHIREIEPLKLFFLCVLGAGDRSDPQLTAKLAA